jgi:hypothetical protein
MVGKARSVVIARKRGINEEQTYRCTREYIPVKSAMQPPHGVSAEDGSKRLTVSTTSDPLRAKTS